jgi:hypothetical protein
MGTDAEAVREWIAAGAGYEAAAKAYKQETT